MEFHWISPFAFALFFLLSGFVMAGLMLMYKALNILALSFERKTNSRIFKPLFFLIAYSLTTVLFRQAVSLHMITFTRESIEFFINLGLGVIHAAVALCLLYKILHDAKAIHRRINH